MVPEEYKASRSAMSFAGCAGFFRRQNGTTVFDLAQEMGPSCNKRVWAMTTGAAGHAKGNLRILTFASLRKIIRRNKYVC
jgi:hypothetical protein